MSKGPNGPSVTSAHKDAIALKKEGLLPIIQRMARLTGTSEIYRNLIKLLESSTDVESCQSGRIALISEPGGKTRTIAIGDF
jgi:hypothetical protein